MSYCILKESIDFKLGLTDRKQLEDFLNSDQAKMPGLAFVGRSNVGKSSLINALFAQRQARVSKTPGRTRQINIFSFFLYDPKTKERLGPFNLFDLPGYGHAEVSKEMKKNWQDLMDAFFSLISQKTLLLNIQDARHPGQKSDLEFYDFLKMHSLLAYLVFNKLDKLKTQKERSIFEKELPFMLKKIKIFKQVFLISAEKKTGIESLSLSLVNYLLSVF